MAGKKKSGRGGKKGKKETKLIDEHQLRRDLRGRVKAADLDMDEGIEDKLPEKVAAEVSSDIRIGGIEG